MKKRTHRLATQFGKAKRYDQGVAKIATKGETMTCRVSVVVWYLELRHGCSYPRILRGGCVDTNALIPGNECAHDDAERNLNLNILNTSR